MSESKKVLTSGNIDEAMDDLETKRIKYNIEHNIIDPPTLIQIQKEVERKQYSTSAQKFFEYYEGRNWIDKFDNPVRDWKKVLLSWHETEKRSQNEKIAGNNASVLQDELWYMKPSDYLYTRAWYIKNHINAPALKICCKIQELRDENDQSTRSTGFLHTYDLLYGYFGWLTQSFDFETKKCIFDKTKEESFEVIEKIEVLKKRIERVPFALKFGNFEALDNDIKHQIERQQESVSKYSETFDSINMFSEL